MHKLKRLRLLLELKELKKGGHQQKLANFIEFLSRNQNL